MFRTGLLALDDALFGENGISGGNVIEIHGTSDSGKTALCLQICKSLQEVSDAPIGWVCTEYNISKRNFEWLGVDPQGVVIVRQTYNLCGLSAAVLLLQEGCKLVVIDSIAALVGEEDKPLTQVISENLYRVKCAAIENNALVVLTNQERCRVPGRDFVRAGVCPALNRMTDVQIRLIPGQGLYRGGLQEGLRVYFQIKKNGPNFDDWNKSGRFNISYKDGLKNTVR